MKRQINVCYLINALHVGGAERVVARTVARLDKNKYEAIVCCLWMRGAVADEIEKAGVRVINLDAKNKLDFRILFRLYRFLKEHKPDILHSFLFHANMVGRLMGRLAGVPIIISSERVMEIEGQHRLLLNKVTAQLAHKIVTVSDNVRKFAIHQIGIAPEKLVTIHNGVDLKEYSVNPKQRWGEERREQLGINPSHRVIGTVGHMEKEKGWDYLLRAIPKVLAQHKEVTFLFVGEGSQKAELKQLARDLGISSRVMFAGYRDDVPQLLPILDVFVLPSIYEGMPNAIIEAMAMERPVVATRVGAVPEVVIDGETGILVARRDADALAEAICLLLEDKQLAKRMGMAGRERVEGLFTVEAMMARTEALYQELIEEKLGST